MPLEECSKGPMKTIGGPDWVSTVTIGGGMSNDSVQAIQRLLRATFDHPERIQIREITYGL